jgi:hypothetical protein
MEEVEEERVGKSFLPPPVRKQTERASEQDQTPLKVPHVNLSLF